MEQYWCPEEFQDRLTQVGGTNPYGEPMFKLVWSQTETFRAGGYWAHDGFTGYRDVRHGQEPCWMLMQWQPAEKYGSPAYYYLMNYDYETGLQMLGEFPYSGRYEVVIPLVWKGIVNGRLVVEHMPLSNLLIDLVVPIIKEAQGLSYARVKQLKAEQKERDDREQLNQIEARLADAFPAFNGAEGISASRLSCNSVVKQKMDAIGRHWQKAAKVLRRVGKGQGQGVLPKYE